MTKKIQAPLPGFGKLIANRFFMHTLSVTLRDATDAVEPDERGAIAAHSPHEPQPEAHRTSLTPL
jgi:hypothetical protein